MAVVWFIAHVPGAAKFPAKNEAMNTRRSIKNEVTVVNASNFILCVACGRGGAAARIGNLRTLALQLRLHTLHIIANQQAQSKKIVSVAVVVVYSCNHEGFMRILPIALQFINSLLQQPCLILLFRAFS